MDDQQKPQEEARVLRWDGLEVVSPAGDFRSREQSRGETCVSDGEYTMT